MSSTLIQGSQHAPYTSALDHDVALRLATTEYERVLATLERLTPAHWASATDCPAWDVRALAGHVLGIAQLASSIPETMRLLDLERGQRVDHQPTVALGRSGPSTDPRLRTPPDVRAGGGRPRGVVDHRVPHGHDPDPGPFMHRIDIARATGVLAPATADHEGVIVDDVVREWARRHGAAYSLELTGPAGGTWFHGDGAAHLSMDAFEFCRALSGRTPTPGLLSQQVPF